MRHLQSLEYIPEYTYREAKAPLISLPPSLKGYIFYTMIHFEFDESKSRSNHEKHGINFIDAQRLWDDLDLVEIEARSTDEPRTLVIGSMNGKVWSAVMTRRGDAIRIISVRRARKAEVAIYES